LAYDFVFVACDNGQKLKCLTLINEFTKESLCIDVAGSIKGKQVVQVLEEVIAQRCYPKVLRSDNGPEFVSTILLELPVEQGLHNLHIEPSKPWQNGTNEIFNGKFRDKCLIMNWFYGKEYAKVIVEVWRKYYNLIRPHSSLDYQIPTEFVDGWQKELTTGARVSR
jgi:putative transposase